MSKKVSDALFLTDVDYILPSQECTIPILPKLKEKSRKSGISVFEKDSTGKYYEITQDGERKELQQKTITLADCLACSGCTTTAESILVNSQTVDHFLEQSKNKFLVITISQESIASIGTFFKIETPDETLRKLITVFRDHFNAKEVFHLNNLLYITKLTTEFLKVYQKDEKACLLSSGCPGFVCYAEKTHGGEIIDYMSKIKSPQSIYGTLLRKYFFPKEKNLFHVSVSPCFDKKLEASRKEFNVEDKNETDLVLTTTEVIELMKKKEIQFEKIKPCEKNFFSDSLYYPTNVFISKSVIQRIVKVLFAKEIKEKDIIFKKGRNSDFLIYKYSGENEKGVTKTLNFAIINGFRNIQTIVRKIKLKKCNYNFIEVNACPKGCLNGGGQISLPKEDARMISKIFEKIDNFLASSKEIGVSKEEHIKKVKMIENDYFTLLHDRRKELEKEKKVEVSPSQLDW